MSQNTVSADYLAPDIATLARQRGTTGFDETPDGRDQTSRSVARRLLHACIVVPTLLWGILFYGEHHNWYSLETCFTLFVFSITIVFALIACINLKKLSGMDAQRAKDQAQLKLAKDAAEEANRFKSMFFANISHEIRTPLTAINGFAELFLNPERTAEERLADARVIRRNGEHLLTLINDILDLSKIEAGKMSVEQILCCPAKIVGEVCSMLRQRAAEKSLTLEVGFEGPIPKLIRTDPTRLRQVLINLVSNAIKFTKQGGVKLNVSITPGFRAVKPLLQVKITDTGIGIPADRQASLFQPFVQGDTSISRQFGGSGLGLAISRHFAQALGGDITASSQPGQGSTFTVTVATGELVNAEIHEHPDTAMDARDEFILQRVRINGKILVAEDGTDNQALIAAKLRETGATVEMVGNGQLAVEKALAAASTNAPFDVILMDVQMPVMDGYTATLTLRGKAYRGPIIALTANAMERDRNKCLSAGCNDFVTKPIEMEKLFKAIGRFLTVTKVVPQSSILKKDATPVTESRATQIEKFYNDLPGELVQIEEAITRQDRVRVKEIAQLLLGKAATAGLKEIAPEAAKLLQSAEHEPSWVVLQQAANNFASEIQPQQPRQAA